MQKSDTQNLEKREQDNKTSWSFNSIFCSFSFWFVVAFLSLNLVVSGVNICRYTSSDALHPLQRAKLAANFKYGQYNNLADAPDILVLGSSLPMSALYYSEGAKFPSSLVEKTKKENVNFFQAYTNGKQLEKLLENKFDKQFSVFNFTTAACMISDIDLIWSKIESTGKVPNQVVLGVGLRDFIDNVNPKFGETPIFKELIYFSYMANNLNQFLCTDGNTVKDLTLSSILPIWKARSEIKIFLEDYLASRTNRKTLQEQIRLKHLAVKEAKDKQIIENNNKLAESTEKQALPERDYQQRYNPPNMVQYSDEMKSFRNLLAKLEKANIPVTVINMPVSEGNKKISSKSVRQKYTKDLAKLATRYNANYVDFENVKDFSNNDFLDTVHLGPSGAIKFLEKLTASFQPADSNQSVASKDKLL